jgi:hypothetical protein
MTRPPSEAVDLTCASSGVRLVMGHFFEFAAFSLSQNAAHASGAHLSEGDLLRAGCHAP